MAVVMEMPKLSDTMKEGAIAKWLSKEGQKVQSGLPVVEIETDKATMEFEAPASGVLLKILVTDGQTCALQAPIAIIGKEGENWQTALDAYTAKKGATQSKKAESASTSGKAPNSPQPTSTQIEASSKQDVKNTSVSDRVKISPLARKMAQEKGLSLSSLSGTGPAGRIVARDVQQTSDVSGSQSRNTRESAPVTRVPVTMMRKTIARRLVESVQQAPHFFLTLSINMGPLLEWRKLVVSKLPENQKFSVNDIMVYLVARALKKHPEINSSWQEDHILQYAAAHVGIAVALPNGLITPVVRNAESLSIIEIASETKALIKAAKDGKLSPDAYSGGTFTISNLGMAGIEEFTAIINPPQAAILAIGSTAPAPAVDSKGNVVVEQRMKVTLSCDHRVIDGAMGAEFLKTLKTLGEDPWNLLLI